jgi:hypothetical protein
LHGLGGKLQVERLGAYNTTIHGGKQQCAHARGYLPSGEVGANRETRSGRKAELFWGKIGSRASTSRHFLRIRF